MRAAYPLLAWAMYLLLPFTAFHPVGGADSSSLVRRSYVLNKEIQTKVLAAHAQATESMKQQGKKLNRGPGRYFLESGGIAFPYRATAEFRDSNHRLVVENTPENLDRIDQLFEELYSRCGDRASLLGLITAAESQYGSEVFVPAPEFLADVDAPGLDKNPEQPPQVFDPTTMDYDTLVCGDAVFTNVIVQGSNPAELRITHQSGSAALPFADLALEIKARYGYDAEKAEAFLESRRQASVAPEPTPASQKPAAKTAEAELQPDAEHASVAQGPGNDPAGGASYAKILCRDGRVFEAVEATKNHRGFQIIPVGSAPGRPEFLEFHNAPSKLLLDFEEFDELFRRAVVANGRTQLYELSRDGAEQGTPFEELAKNPPSGNGFVSVPEGYLMANMNWISLPASAVELVVPVGPRLFAVANAGNLVGMEVSKWWNDYAGHRKGVPLPGRLEKREPSENGVLYSPFNPESPVLGNTMGEIQRLWVEQHAGRNGALALVETGNGLFFGYYREHVALEASELTWSDVTRESSERFRLTKVSSKKINLGESFLKLFDASARKVLGAEFKEVAQLKLSGQHFQALLQRGVEAAVQDRILPKGDGVEFPQTGIESASSPALDIVTITDQVDAKLKDVLPHAYVFDVESKQRVIEIRKDNSSGRTKFDESRPQRRRQIEVVEVPPDLDGGLRVTDGKRIYELKPALGGTELVVWEAERNKLKR